jgi:hypothetical protein
MIAPRVAGIGAAAVDQRVDAPFIALSIPPFI